MPHSHTDHQPHSHTHSHPHPHDHDHDHGPDPHRIEEHHQATVQATFDLYKRHALATNQQRRADFYALPKHHRDLVPDYNALLREVRPPSSSPRSLSTPPTLTPRAPTRAQIDGRLTVNAALVQRMADANPFPPPPDAALDAPAPTEADHEVRPRLSLVSLCVCRESAGLTRCRCPTAAEEHPPAVRARLVGRRAFPSPSPLQRSRSS